MKNKIKFLLVLLILCASYNAQAQYKLTTTLYATTSDTITNTSSDDTSRTFNAPTGVKLEAVQFTYYKSSTGFYRTAFIDYPVEFVTQFRVNYDGADSNAYVEGKVHGNWVQLPVFHYSTVSSRPINMPGGGTAWVSFDGYAFRWPDND